MRSVLSILSIVVCDPTINSTSSSRKSIGPENCHCSRYCLTAGQWMFCFWLIPTSIAAIRIWLFAFSFRSIISQVAHFVWKKQITFAYRAKWFLNEQQQQFVIYTCSFVRVCVCVWRNPRVSIFMFVG